MKPQKQDKCLVCGGDKDYGYKSAAGLRIVNKLCPDPFHGTGLAPNQDYVPLPDPFGHITGTGGTTNQGHGTPNPDKETCVIAGCKQPLSGWISGARVCKVGHMQEPYPPIVSPISSSHEDGHDSKSPEGLSEATKSATEVVTPNLTPSPSVKEKRCGHCAGTGRVEDYETNMPSIVAALEFRRDQYGWTKKRMASELGVQNTHYGEFVNGKRRLPLEARVKAHRIGVPAVVLLQTDERHYRTEEATNE